MPVPSGKEDCANRATIDLLVARSETPRSERAVATGTPRGHRCGRKGCPTPASSGRHRPRPPAAQAPRSLAGLLTSGRRLARAPWEANHTVPCATIRGLPSLIERGRAASTWDRSTRFRFVADGGLRARAAASAKAEARRGSRLSDGIVYCGQSPFGARGAGGMGSPAALRACCMAGNAPAPAGA